MAEDENKKEELNEEIPAEEREAQVLEEGKVLLMGDGGVVQEIITKEESDKLKEEAETEAPTEHDPETEPVSITNQGQPDTSQNDAVENAKQSSFVANSCPDTIFSRALIASMRLNKAPSMDNYKHLLSTIKLDTLTNADGLSIDSLGEDFKEMFKLDKDTEEDEIDEYYKKFCDGEDEEERAKKRAEFDSRIEELFSKGFSVESNSGNKITFSTDPETMESKFTSQNGKKFDQETAETMIAVAAAAGWRNLTISGTAPQKDKLWLEIQKKNLVEECEFNRLKADGKLEGQEYIPLKCADDSFIPSVKMQKEFDKFRKQTMANFEDHMKNQNKDQEPSVSVGEVKPDADLKDTGPAKKAPAAKIK